MNLEKAFAEARIHARFEYPRESCGLIVNGEYLPCKNSARPVEEHREENCECQLCSFVMDTKDFAAVLTDDSVIQMVVHSHPDGPDFPSDTDAASQMEDGLAWAIIPLDAERIGDMVIWGGDTPIEPVIGRKFRHFTSDCFTLIRDIFSLGKEELAKQDIDWPFDPVLLPDFPRRDGWWNGDDDFYATEPSKIGFVEIAAHEAKPGDVFLMSIRSTKMNHGGLLVGGGLILHHLPHRLSRREPSGLWGAQVEKWIRFVGDQDA